MMCSPAKLHSNASDGGSGGAGRSICSICYEDFKPITEHLQSISICGHVFHELCIQQWLEYCPAGKKPTCPVCKQKYSHRDVVRLYFQSAGDTGEGQGFSSQKPIDEVEDKALRADVGKLKERLVLVTAAFDQQKNRINELSDEVLMWKDRAKNEESLKEASRKERELIHQLLQTKREEISKMTTECSQLKERSLALAKELAAFKLATDVNLSEEDVVKFASVGHGSGHAEIIDILKKSLILRNKSYKELIEQCTLLGRAETRANKKLEKAEEKIKKLKARLQEIEVQHEEKENTTLRNLKISNETLGNVQVDVRYNDSSTGICVSENHTRGLAPSANESSRFSFLPPFPSQQFGNAAEFKKETVPLNSTKNDDIASDLVDDSFYFTNVNRNESSSAEFSKHSVSVLECQIGNQLSRDVAVPIVSELGQNVPQRKNTSNCLLVASSGGIVNIEDDSNKIKEETNVCNSEHSAHESTLSGKPRFLSGLLGSEGSTIYPGKWCRRGQVKVIPGMHTSTNGGSLIAIGADGRGGRIKVLRAPNQCLDKAHSQNPKRQKQESKQVGISRGHLQIEHFFMKK